jgi:hypothetical protein
MTRLPREAELDVLLGREPDEVGEGRLFEMARRACRGSSRPANSARQFETKRARELYKLTSGASCRGLRTRSGFGTRRRARR